MTIFDLANLTKTHGQGDVKADTCLCSPDCGPWCCWGPKGAPYQGEEVSQLRDVLHLPLYCRIPSLWDQPVVDPLGLGRGCNLAGLSRFGGLVFHLASWSTAFDLLNCSAPNTLRCSSSFALMVLSPQPPPGAR